MEIKISIITVNYNNTEGLEATIESVLKQTNKNYEYIIIDGGSTDGSKEIIEKYASQIDYWVSEPDKGIYNAMNKGIKQAKGEYLLFLNSGDYLISTDVLEKVAQELDGLISFVACGIRLQDDNGYRVKQHPNEISFGYLYTSSLAHQSTFIHRKIFDKYGYYNESYKIVSDWEIFFKAICLNGESYKKSDIVVSNFSCDGVSSSNQELLSLERKTTIQNHLKYLIRDEYSEYLIRSTINKNKRITYLMNIEKSLFLSGILNKIMYTMSLLSLLYQSSKALIWIENVLISFMKHIKVYKNKYKKGVNQL
jgi:glycosyltransferase involved in cell wall biosynthesis